MATATKGKGKAGTKITWFETLKSPKGTAGFNYLRDPDEKFGAKHRIQVFIDQKDPEFKPFVSALVDAQKKFLASIKKKDNGKVPGLKKADAYMAEKFGQYGVKEGDLYFEFTSNARKVEGTDDWQHVETYNSKNVVDPNLRVFSGDVVRVAVRLGGYNTGKEVGVKPYLNAVQVLVKKGSGGRVNPFADESASFPTTEATSGGKPTTASASSDESTSTDNADEGDAVPAEDGAVDLADLA